MKVQGLYMLERIKIILTCTSGLCPELEISFLHVFNYKYVSIATNITWFCLQNQDLSNLPLKVSYIQSKMTIIKLIAGTFLRCIILEIQICDFTIWLEGRHSLYLGIRRAYQKNLVKILLMLYLFFFSVQLHMNREFQEYWNGLIIASLRGNT